jgi:GNAT superfamily N-acetyltransferase
MKVSCAPYPGFDALHQRLSRYPSALPDHLATEMSAYEIRRCTVEDAPIVARHRVEMFREMGEVPNEALAGELLDKSAAVLAATLADGSYIGWFAADHAGRVIAGAGAHIKPQLPRMAHDRLRVEVSPVPLVVNVYTEPEWRGRGVARALMRVLMEWGRAAGSDRVVLHASNAGRPLYVSLGFHPTNEMRWFP